MSGKSEYVGRLILGRDHTMDKKFDRIVYVYDEWQNLYDKLQQDVPEIIFTKNIKDVLENEVHFHVDSPTLLILDDVANEIADSPLASKLFTQKIHHKNVSTILMLNNLYRQGKSMRDIHLNASYIMLLNSVRGRDQIKTLARQMGLAHLRDAYDIVMEEPYQPLIIDLKTDTPEYLRVRSHILPGENLRVYTDPSTTSLPIKDKHVR